MRHGKGYTGAHAEGQRYVILSFRDMGTHILSTNSKDNVQP